MHGFEYNEKQRRGKLQRDLSKFVSFCCLLVFSLAEEIDIAFVINATSDSANEAFQLMKKIAKYVMEEKNNHQMKYQVVVHGEDSSSTGICFDDDPVPDVRTLSDRVDRLMRKGGSQHSCSS